MNMFIGAPPCTGQYMAQLERFIHVCCLVTSNKSAHMPSYSKP